MLVSIDGEHIHEKRCLVLINCVFIQDSLIVDHSRFIILSVSLDWLKGHFTGQLHIFIGKQKQWFPVKMFNMFQSIEPRYILIFKVDPWP